MKILSCVFAALLAGVAGASTEPLTSATGGSAQRRAQNTTIIAPARASGAAEQKSEAQTQKVADATLAKEADAKLDDSATLNVRAVVVIPGKGVDRKLRDVVRDAVEDALSDKGTITSKELDRQLLLVRQQLINQGYYLSRIMRVGDGGTISEGILPLKLQVGTVQEIEVSFKGREPGEDGKYFTAEQMEKRLEGVKTGDGFNYAKLYLALYGFNSHPDLQADVNVGVSKNGEEGDATAKFALTIEEDIPLHGSLELNNYAIDALDNWQVVGMVQYLNLTKADDVLTLSPSATLSGDQWSMVANYMRPFSFWRGGHTTLYAGYTDTKVSDLEANRILRELSYDSTGYFLGAQMNFNLLDTPEHLIQGFVGLQYRYTDQNLRFLGVDLSDYKLGVLPITAGLNYMNRNLDALNGRNFVTVSGTFNIDCFHDDIRKIWLDAEDNYMIFRAQYARIQPLFGSVTLDQGFDAMWTGFFRMEAQWSSETLISHEQVLLGGHNNLRGYRTNAYAGDRGLYGTLEFRTPVWRDLIAGYFRENEDPDGWLDAVQLFAFLDYGVLERDESRYAQSEAQSLISIGLGMRAQLTKYLSLDADVGLPLRDVDDKENEDHDDDFEVYVGVRAQF